MKDTMAGEYVVVYGDIEHSRRSGDRGQLARDMRASLEARNRALRDRLQGRFTLRAIPRARRRVARVGSLPPLIKG